MLSAALNPSDATNFKGLIPDDTKKRDISIPSVKTGTVSTVDVALRAVNTYADNRVHVYDFKKESFGNLSGSKRTLTGTLTLRANCAAINDTAATPTPTACFPNSRHLGPSPVFILRADAAEDIEFDGLKLKLEGVDPNNIFWIFPKVAGADNVMFKASDPNFPNVVTGNFIATMPSSGTDTEATSTDLTISDRNTSFRGVRFLGFRSLVTKIDSSVVMAALSSVDQPELIPVLQLQFPNPTDANLTRFVNTTNNLQPLFRDTDGKRKDSGINGVPKTNQGQWTIRPIRSEVNAYFVAGTTPSRNGMSYRTSNTASTSSSIDWDGSNNTIPSTGVNAQALTNLGESSGGLVNFIRLLENWEAVPIKITGGFLQNTRSVFSTAPYLPTAPFISEISGANFVPFSDIQTLYINPVLPNIRMSGYNLAYQGVGVERIPYFSAPIRLWGYDVGLLTQQPDRFAERFATAKPGSNEFFREVNADDKWVKALLCALEPSNPSDNNASTPGTYSKTIVNSGGKQQFGTIPENYTVRALLGTVPATSTAYNYCNETEYGGSTPITPSSRYE